ncbi:MAG: hypothetical protein M3N54_04410, partial [Acidobacteriota bacterium]|nr:hypothetical protein [Acidobacteriota bacterium]
MDIQEQLSYLRQTVARIDAKFTPPAPVKAEPGGFLEDLLTGDVVETLLGRHFETETLYGNDKRHGSYDISELIALRPDLLHVLSDGS